jgi:FixJ family two-component response regulator
VALVEPLTEKEQEVLAHLAELLTTYEIAGVMFVSVNTVRTMSGTSCANSKSHDATRWSDALAS